MGMTAATSQKLRVAAYIRVSTELDIQENSFEVQERYYTDLIRTNPDWRTVGIYADNGVTGTSRTDRTGFQRLMRHCEEGKIDRVLCKSISRFARNTVDMLDSVRKLKDHGVSVFFEKENLDSLSIQSEFVLSTIAAIAQEESRSISDNTLWAYVKRFEAGQVLMQRILGYRVSRELKRDPQVITVDSEEAETVRMIFTLYISGYGLKQIAEEMIRRNRLNAKGTRNWSYSYVKSVLQNEKYVGDYLCQKTYTADYLTHQVKKNRGERKKYLIENHHPAIIDRETWNTAQLLLIRHRPWQTRGTRYPLAGRVHCGSCGANFRRSNCQSRVKWVCGRRLDSKLLCETEGVYEDAIVSCIIPAFVERFGTVNNGRKILDIRQLLITLRTVQDFDNIERQRVIMKRQIATAEPVEREKLEGQLTACEHLWELLEVDRRWRAEAIEWLKALEDRKAETNVILSVMTANVLRAWAVDITVYPDHLTVLWLDGATDEAALMKPATTEEWKHQHASKTPNE